MRLIIIRHGEVSWNNAVDNDPPLNDNGHEQARRLGMRFENLRIDRLYSSPMVRAKQTTSYVSKTVGLEPEILPWLREIRSPLLTETEMAHVEARPLEQWWDGFPGEEETFRTFQERVATGTDALLARFGVRLGRVSEGARPGPEEQVCIVCHAGVAATLLCHLAGIKPVPWEWYRFGMGYTGVSHARIRPLCDAVISTLTLFNCRKHLD